MTQTRTSTRSVAQQSTSTPEAAPATTTTTTTTSSVATRSRRAAASSPASTASPASTPSTTASATANPNANTPATPTPTMTTRSRGSAPPVAAEPSSTRSRATSATPAPAANVAPAATAPSAAAASTATPTTTPTATAAPATPVATQRPRSRSNPKTPTTPTAITTPTPTAAKSTATPTPPAAPNPAAAPVPVPAATATSSTALRPAAAPAAPAIAPTSAPVPAPPSATPTPTPTPTAAPAATAQPPETSPGKRPRGRPRKNPLPTVPAPKRPRGRPRKDAQLTPATPTPATPTATQASTVSTTPKPTTTTTPKPTTTPTPTSTTTPTPTAHATTPTPTARTTPAPTAHTTTPLVTAPLPVALPPATPGGNICKPVPGAAPGAPDVNFADLKKYVDNLKESLKKVRTFPSVIGAFTTLLQNYLSNQTKTIFYHALNIISYRVGKRGFAAALAKPAFDIAFERRACFTAGYRTHIAEWKQTCDAMVAGTFNAATYNRGDGRFGTPSRIIARVGNGLSFLRNLFGFYDPFLDDEYYSSDEPYSPNYDYDSDGYEEDDFIPPRYAFHYARPPLALDAVSYPFLALPNDTDQAIGEFSLLPPKVLPHANTFLQQSLGFTVGPQLDKALREGDAFQVRLVCVMASEAQTYRPNGVRPPEQLSFLINGKQVNLQLAAGAEVKFGYDLSKDCVAGENMLIVQAHSCCCSYAFGVRVVKRIAVAKLVEQVTEKPAISKETGLKLVKATFGDNSDVTQVYTTVSLHCPLSLSFIKIPVKDTKCNHIQCFDLESYLNYNRTQPDWECPICNKRAPLSELRIDEYMKEILQQIGNDDKGDTVRLDEQGQWTLVEYTKHEGQVDDDDDDYPAATTTTTTSTTTSSVLGKRTTAEAPAISNPQPNKRPMPVIIDLT